MPAGGEDEGRTRRQLWDRESEWDAEKTLSYTQEGGARRAWDILPPTAPTRAYPASLAPRHLASDQPLGKYGCGCG